MSATNSNLQNTQQLQFIFSYLCGLDFVHRLATERFERTPKRYANVQRRHQQQLNIVGQMCRLIRRGKHIEAATFARINGVYRIISAHQWVWPDLPARHHHYVEQVCDAQRMALKAKLRAAAKRRYFPRLPL